MVQILIYEYLVKRNDKFYLDLTYNRNYPPFVWLANYRCLLDLVHELNAALAILSTVLLHLVVTDALISPVHLDLNYMIYC